MVSSRKRGRQEADIPDAPPATLKEPSLLDSIRNMWEFANLAQWIFIFGKAVKIDESLDIEDLEMECLVHDSTVLSEIGLALLKFVSSHRGLTPEIFDEYTRRQYIAKAPQRNPFGDEDEPLKFTEFDIFTKIRILQQLTQWTFNNPDRIRERMDEQKDSEQTYWRVEPFGWDSEDRTYIVLDDNRLYRQIDAPPPKAPKAGPKKNSKAARAAVRASKRRKLSEPVQASEDEANDEGEEEVNERFEGDEGLGGARWECIAISLGEFNDFIASIQKSRDPNEKILRERITEDLLPLLQKQEESRQRKEAQKQRELLNLEKLATAKRSSRIAGRAELQKQEEAAREAERKKQADLVMAKKEQERWQKLEKERESRMQTREQRIKEREARRILHEAELLALSEDSKKLETGEGRMSERHLKAEMERKKAALEELVEDEDWVFDCICGAHGQVDDGTHSIACEKCNVWQHTACVGISEEAANHDDFIFVCKPCKKREKDAEAARKQKMRDEEEAKRRKAREEERRAKELEEARNRPPSGIKIKLGRPGSSSSSPALAAPQFGGQANGASGSSLKPSLGTFYTNGGHPNGNGSYPQYRPTASPPQGIFSVPQAQSPTSLPPPNSGRTYTSITQAQSGGPSMFSSPAAAYYQTPNARPAGQQSHTAERRPSMGFPSPMNGAPVLQPSPSYQASPPANGYNHNGSTAPRISSSPIQSFTTPAHSQMGRHVSDPGHLSALPPASTGISPTKNSPPRASPSTVNGILSHIAATPHSIPPVASLSPSPQSQNLTPPVKTGIAYTAPFISAIASPTTSALPQIAAETALAVEKTTPLKPANLPPPHTVPAPQSSPIKSPSPVAAFKASPRLAEVVEPNQKLVAPGAVAPEPVKD